MKIITNPIKDIKNFFSSKFKNIEKKIDQDTKELNEIENKIKNLQKDNIEGFMSAGWTNQKMIKFWLFALLIGILGYLVYSTSSFIFTIIAAYIVSMIVETFVSFFQKLGLKRSLSIFLSYFIFVLILFFLFVIIVPFILTQTVELIGLGINYLSGIEKDLTNDGVYNIIMNNKYLPDFWKEYFFEYFGENDFLIQIQNTLQQNISEIMSLGKEYATKVWFMLIGFVSGFTTFLWDFVIFMTLSVLFSVEKKSVMNFISRLSGKKNYKIVYFKLNKIYKRLGLWLKARLILSLFMALSLFLALWILEIFGMSIPNKFSLALVLGIFDIIPYIGPVVGSVPAVIGGFTGYGAWGGIIIIIIAVTLNLIENSVLIPILMGKRLGMNTIVVFVSIIFGGMLMGLLGIFLAVPIAVVITLLIENDADISDIEKETIPKKNNLENSSSELLDKEKS